MRNPLVTFLNFVAPIVFGVLILVITFTAAQIQLQFYLPIIGIMVINSNIENNMLAKLILCLLALILFAVPAFRNYQRFYPTAMKFLVFIEQKQLESSLQTFSEAERKSLNIEMNWKDYQHKYIEKLNNLVKQQPNVPSQMEFADTSWGRGLFALRIESTGHWQQYEVVEAEATMQFDFTDRQGQSIMLMLYNTLVPSATDTVQASLKDIYISWTKVVQLTFKSTIQIAPGRHLQLDDTIALTKIRFFPTIRISDTIYLVKKACVPGCSGDELIPIAYAHYMGI